MADPGGGKSTLAAAFAQEGYPFLTDDVLALAEGPCGYFAYPGFPSVSLSGNSLHALFGPKKGLAQTPPDGEKKRLAISGNWAQFQHDPVPVQGLFILNRASEGAAIAIERLPRAEEAMHGLLANTSCLPILPVTVLRQQLAFVARLTKSVPVWRLTYPSGFQHTSNIIERLLILTASGSEIPIRVAP